MHYWFGFFQSILEEQAPKAAQKNLNLKILNNLQVFVPPLELQHEFVDFVAQVDKSRFVCVLASQRFTLAGVSFE